MNGFTTKQMAIDAVISIMPYNEHWKNEVKNAIEDLPEICPEITYAGLSNALLYLWIENIITDKQYYKIMDKLNEVHKRM